MTAYDGPAPGIEIWPASPEYCDAGVAQQSMQRSLDMARRAEELGFDWVSVSEHHYAPYMMTPNPLIMAASEGRAEVVSLLLDRGARLEEVVPDDHLVRKIAAVLLRAPDRR